METIVISTETTTVANIPIGLALFRLRRLGVIEGLSLCDVIAELAQDYCPVAESFQFTQIYLVGFNGVEVLLRPSARVLEGRCRHDDVAGNQFLGLDEGTVVNADAVAGVPVTPAPPAGTHAFR